MLYLVRLFRNAVGIAMLWLTVAVVLPLPWAAVALPGAMISGYVLA